MSPDAVTAERLYHDVREAIMAGEFRPGASLITSQIADRFGTSVTPVRDALHRLVGERAIMMQAGGGFVVPTLDPLTISHLYRWQADILHSIARNVPQLELIGEAPVAAQSGTAGRVQHAQATGQLFERLARLSNNPEHLEAISALHSRLQIVRRHEYVLGRCRSELHSLWEHIHSGNKHKARIALWHYHKRRLLSVEKIYEQISIQQYVVT
ncbi:DNA-binding transcriptional regulator, GntR family [Sphingobium sp. AP50]|uniref:GntR family transcriptional regulator n=1 Tax=Sphingobium sp. AP50 TaxID=1884369 RepID=UPI0008B19981|nr:GntR family transcriptional regulator [Sphingobium sp. AP50]SEK03960.1 DNA-binding transcriptional regulator, GntR family [Sphingobium sp. AP50]